MNEDRLRAALRDIEALRTSSNRQGSPVSAFMDGVSRSAAILRAALAATPDHDGLDVELVRESKPMGWTTQEWHEDVDRAMAEAVASWLASPDAEEALVRAILRADITDPHEGIPATRWDLYAGTVARAVLAHLRTPPSEEPRRPRNAGLLRCDVPIH